MDTELSRLEDLASRLAALPAGERARLYAHTEERFEKLAGQWHEETAYLSSPDAMRIHPAYQRIIGMGLPAVPLLLREMEQRPNHWHWALSAITEENPVPPEHFGHLDLIARDWTHWGRAQGYSW